MFSKSIKLSKIFQYLYKRKDFIRYSYMQTELKQKLVFRQNDGSSISYLDIWLYFKNNYGRIIDNYFKISSVVDRLEREYYLFKPNQNTQNLNINTKNITNNYYNNKTLNIIPKPTNQKTIPYNNTEPIKAKYSIR